MIVRKGLDWGDEADPNLPTVAISGERALAELLSAGPPFPPVALKGGDLFRTLGGVPGHDRVADASAQQMTVDIGEAQIDGIAVVFASHLVARHWAWRGRIVAVMNAAFIGRWNVAPRAHPNDGRLDVIDARLGAGDRLKAWRRLARGTHVPHPDISERRVREATLDFGESLTVWADGRHVGRCHRVTVTVKPDALTLVV